MPAMAQVLVLPWIGVSGGGHIAGSVDACGAGEAAGGIGEAAGGDGMGGAGDRVGDGEEG